MPQKITWCTVFGVPALGFLVASIQERKRADGKTVYRAQIVIKKKGKIIHREGATFDDKRDAVLWSSKREKELSSSDGLEKAQARKSDVTLSDLIELYEKKVKPIKEWGKTKQDVLNALKDGKYRDTPVSEIDSAWLIDYCLERRTGGAGRATVNQDYSFMRSVFSVSKDVLRVPVSVLPFDEARPTLAKLDLVGKSEERDRRPEHDEISEIMARAHSAVNNAYGRSRDNSPIDKIILFQMFSSRRISETCRIKWADLDEKKKRVLVRDMKDPGRKQGNDVWTLLTDEAFNIIQQMPRVDERIFPYNPRSVEARYQRLRDKSGYTTGTDEDLRLHDLRHECLSWLAEKNGLEGENWDIPRLQMVSGHKNWNVLQRYVNLLTAEPFDRWKGWEWRP